MSARCDVNHSCVDSLVMVREEIIEKVYLLPVLKEKERERET